MAGRNTATLTIPSADGRENISLVIDRLQGKLLTPAGSELDRKMFLSLRDRRGAMIIADDPKEIRKLLKLRANDTGVVGR